MRNRSRENRRQDGRLTKQENKERAANCATRGKGLERTSSKEKSKRHTERENREKTARRTTCRIGEQSIGSKEDDKQNKRT
jgi:hypothetical protein